MKTYPIKFTPILQDKIWGGQKLKTVLNKQTDLNRVGESWEISSVKDAISVVANGMYKGKSLIELIAENKTSLLGEKVYQQFGNTFPLLIKFIDATENLSIQLHPNDELAQKRHNSFGKTEMWYVVDADKGAELNVGFSKEMTPEAYQQAVAEKKVLDVCNFEKVQAGDSYFIKAGLVHAIGAGCLIAEIQQTSDITYRIYDWDRVDDQGNERELHTDLAVEALDYSECTDVKCRFEKKKNQPSEIATCDYFTTNYLKVNDLFTRDLLQIASFVVYICVGGSGTIIVNGIKENIQSGETILIPANAEKVDIEAQEIELLEVYIK
ncbi:type I phosphomannose isomerase catalytic subunit [Wenyingzhuangia aestuarii]|uniref:type I phosphomannose isomerase catalytic subunit n=1 Tax=Wenyingzhuangia aestuarii TaxID=1647582 RepID=UPI0014397BAE|nr:type I phosphomannose isomerase catalytic subunit [Wenyingzhuangia aestuarii]NJB83262.1 mannose-6-phosphate isomerase [Wenyingzhuangia aestuarii]